MEGVKSQEPYQAMPSPHKIIEWKIRTFWSLMHLLGYTYLQNELSCVSQSKILHIGIPYSRCDHKTVTRSEENVFLAEKAKKF